MSEPRILRPRSNRLTPLGTIETTKARGTVLANRGDLHSKDGRIVHLWRHTRWITCTLAAAGGRRVTFDTPGRYTPLFGLDEATALAAGHRPCAECQRPAYNAFLAAWRRAKGRPDNAPLRTRELDEELHRARIRRGQQVTHAARLDDLPDGTFVILPNVPDAPTLLWRGELRAWSHTGYGPPRAAPTDTLVTVLTPIPTVAALRAGYQPRVWLAPAAPIAFPRARPAQDVLDPSW